MITPYLPVRRLRSPLTIDTAHLPALRRLVDELADLPAVTRVIPDDGWADPCSACPEPRHGGPEQPHPAVGYIRRDFTVGTITSVYREPVCERCLPAAVRWEMRYRGAGVVHVDLIAGAA